MELRPALTTLLVQFPPSATGTAGLVGGFLGSGLPGIRLARVGQGASAALDGVLWGNLAVGGAAMVLGVVVLLGRRQLTTRRARVRASLAILSAGPAGLMGTLLGIAAGLLASGAVPPAGLMVSVLESGWGAWPCLVVPATVALAVGLSALEVR